MLYVSTFDYTRLNLNICVVCIVERVINIGDKWFGLVVLESLHP